MLRRTYRDLLDKGQYRQQFNLELKRRARKQKQKLEKTIEERARQENSGQLTLSLGQGLIEIEDP